MKNFNIQSRYQALDTPSYLEPVNNSDKNNVYVSRYLFKSNLNIQNKSSDKQSAQEVHQAILDDQSLSEVDIHVTVKDGAITLDGQVSTRQEMNLATNTATAVRMVDEINNHLEIIHKK